MADTEIIDIPKAVARRQKSHVRDLFEFTIKFGLCALFVRSFIVAPYNIPSKSMMPRLLVGDDILVTKYNYGVSSYSLPLSVPLLPERIMARAPERGEVVVFKAPPNNKLDYIKRVIGLPGDTVQVVHGQLILNGKPLPKQRIGDLVAPPAPNQPCPDEAKDICHFPRYRETLPNGKSFEVLDLGDSIGDDTQLFKVPANHLFVMGDNRDNSEDSRFSIEHGGIAMVPMDNLVGHAWKVFYSWDEDADWAHKVRWGRIGGGFE